MLTDVRSQEAQAIVRRLVDALIAAGYSVAVNDGEEFVTPITKDADLIYAALGTTDQDYLYAYEVPVNSVRKAHGWVWLIWENEEDVISNCTVNLNDIVDPIIDALPL